MKSARALVLVSGALIATLIVLALPAAADPQLQISNSSPQFGQKIVVSGSGFSPSSVASVSVCGNSAQRGTKDCSLESSTSGIDSNGRLNVDLHVQPPPVECSCVVSVSVKGNRTSAPISLPSFIATEIVKSIGHPSAKVTAIKLGNPASVSGQWGGPTTRPVGITVTNSSDTPIQNVDLKIEREVPLHGKSSNTESFLVDIPPGSSKQIVTEISLPVFAAGSLVVRASVAAEGSESFSETSSSSVFVAPWYLLFAIAIALQLWVLTVVRRNEVLRRNRKKLNKLEESPCEESSLV